MPCRSKGESRTCQSCGVCRFCRDCADGGADAAVIGVPCTAADAIIMKNVDVRGAMRWDRIGEGMVVADTGTAALVSKEVW